MTTTKNSEIRINVRLFGKCFWADGRTKLCPFGIFNYTEECVNYDLKQKGQLFRATLYFAVKPQSKYK